MRPITQYHIFEYYSTITGVGVSVIGLSGESLFMSSLYDETAGLMRTLHAILDCEEACRVAFLYACYQARRFGGRYIFLAPSGLTYCTSHLLDISGNMVAGVLVGQFLMADHDEYMDIDIMGTHAHAVLNTAKLRQELEHIPLRTPA